MYVSLHSHESYNRQAYQLNSQGSLAFRENNAAAQNTLLQKLSEHIPGVSASDLAQQSADQFTPSKVANRIADFVAMGLEQARRDGKSEEQIQSLYNQAVSGIEKGFNEARDILKDMNLLSADIAATIDTTYDLTLNAVRQFDPSAASQSVSSTETSLSAAERYQQAESFSLKLKTQDGDQVSIRFSAMESFQASLGAYSDGNTSAAVFSIDRQAASQFQFQVKGELDEGEIEAIQNLIQDMSLIADDFFDGDLQSAFNKATEFELDKSELSSMHLLLTRSMQHTQVGAYQQVQNNQSGEDLNPGKKVGHLLQNFANVASQRDLGFVNNVTEFGQELLSQLVQQDQRYREEDTEQQSLFERNLNQLNQLITSIVGPLEASPEA